MLYKLTKRKNNNFYAVKLSDEYLDYDENDLRTEVVKLKIDQKTGETVGLLKNVRVEFPETWIFDSIIDGDWMVVNANSRFVLQSLRNTTCI